MNSLMWLVYLTAMGVSIALERQSRRQKAEIALECAKSGLPLPPSRPKVQALEALLSIAIGLVMLVPALLGFWMIVNGPFISRLPYTCRRAVINFRSLGSSRSIASHKGGANTLATSSMGSPCRRTRRSTA